MRHDIFKGMKGWCSSSNPKDKPTCELFQAFAQQAGYEAEVREYWRDHWACYVKCSSADFNRLYDQWESSRKETT